MINHRVRTLVGQLGLISAVFGTGCVTGIESGSELRSSQQVLPFRGYSTVPGAELQIEAYNKKTEKWEAVGSTHAVGHPTTVGEETPYNGYEWTFPVKVADLTPGTWRWRCFIHASCTVPAQREKVSFRVRDWDGTPTYLYTFGPGGVACVQRELDNGETLPLAYDKCKPDGTPYSTDEITMIKPQGLSGSSF